MYGNIKVRETFSETAINLAPFWFVQEIIVIIDLYFPNLI